MVGIRHSRQVTREESLTPAVEINYDEWNEEHIIDDASISVAKLSDHTKTVHDALGLDHASLSNITASQHHARYTDAEVDAIVAVHTAITDAHHVKYTDAEAISAVEGADGLTFTGGLTLGGDLTMNGNITMLTGSTLTLETIAPIGTEIALTGQILLFPRTSLRDWAAPNVRLALMNRVGTLNADFQCGGLYSGGWIATGNPSYLRAGSTPGRYVEFRDGNNNVIGWWGKATSEFEISRAGDITFLADKRLIYPNISLKEHGGGYLRIRDAADTADRHLLCNIIDMGQIKCTQYNYTSIIPRSVADSKLLIYSYTGSINEVCAGAYGSAHGSGWKIHRGAEITMLDGANIIVDTTTGTKIGTATNQKLGFFNATPVVQQPYTAVSDPPTQTEVTAIRDALVNLGLMASS